VNYYNEFDPKAAAWLQELISRGLLPPGYVDTRSITDISPDDLTQYTQCHFFAGIGGWPLALALAGWPASVPVWTGSCPCQPFSNAGLQLGTADPRHLWPTFHRIIAHAKPSVVFGEQVASKTGREWLVGVRADMEALAYDFGAADLCAAGVGSPHIRQRLYWGACRMGDALLSGLEGHAGDGHNSHQSGRVPAPQIRSTTSPSCAGGVAHSALPPEERFSEQRIDIPRQAAWGAWVFTDCADEKTRRIEPGLAPLADGLPARVVRLRGYGNAIVPQLAAEFIQAFQEARYV
jgi:DNA (cytosine-5)-methyltransferase 1